MKKLVKVFDVVSKAFLSLLLAFITIPVLLSFIYPSMFEGGAGIGYAFVLALPVAAICMILLNILNDKFKTHYWIAFWLIGLGVFISVLLSLFITSLGHFN